MKNPSLFSRAILAAVPLLALGTACVCHGQKPVKADFTLPTTIHAEITTSDCDNSGGPEVRLDGAITVGEFKTKFIFKNNKRGKRTGTVVVTNVATSFPLSQPITIPKQPSRGGVGGNPHVYIQFRDNEGNNLTDEYLIGRCGQGLAISPEVLSKVSASAAVEIAGCSNRKGPDVTVGCGIALSGLKATLIFRNNARGTHTTEVTTDVTLVTEGGTIQFPKKRAKGGVGRNPLIGIQFLHQNDEPMCDPIMLGRCNKL